jgi:hypothetical protein
MLMSKTAFVPRFLLLKIHRASSKIHTGTSARAICAPPPLMVPGTPGGSKHARSFQQGDFRNNLPSLAARAVIFDFFMWIFFEFFLLNFEPKTLLRQHAKTIIWLRSIE